MNCDIENLLKSFLEPHQKFISFDICSQNSIQINCEATYNCMSGMAYSETVILYKHLFTEDQYNQLISYYNLMNL